jgi:hypothetical protein
MNNLSIRANAESVHRAQGVVSTDYADYTDVSELALPDSLLNSEPSVDRLPIELVTDKTKPGGNDYRRASRK